MTHFFFIARNEEIIEITQLNSYHSDPKIIERPFGNI